MMSSLYTGVSSLSSNQMKIDVISNNIANANTIGYKYQTVTFEDTLYQTMSGATAPDGDSGGLNPMQVGLGVTIGSMSTVNTMGSFQYTGNPTDLAISGEGYFVVMTPEGTYNFTRAGNFGVDSEGNLITSEGYQVCGWQEMTLQEDGSYAFTTTSSPQPINIYDLNGNSSITVAPSVTTQVTMSGNLDAGNEVQGIAMDNIGNVDDLEADYVSPLTIFDELGGSHTVQMNYYKCYTETNDNGEVETSYYWSLTDDDGNVLEDGYLKFDGEGQILDDDNYPLELSVTFDPGVENGTNSFNFDLDLSATTMYGSESNVLPMHIDGNGAGELMDFTIDANGVIMGFYSNGEQQPLGVMSIATFDNPQGLLKTGNNMYEATPNSGDFNIGNPPGTNGAGELSVGTLEMSNVDLSKEYSELIVAQRGYQASTSIISTVDELLQELINLKR